MRWNVGCVYTSTDLSVIKKNILFSRNKSLSDMMVVISTFPSPHLTCRGGKDPAWFFQEELQGPLEATTHVDEGGEGQVRPLLSHWKANTQDCSLLTQPAHFVFVCSAGFHVQSMQRGGNYSWNVWSVEWSYVLYRDWDFIATEEFHLKKAIYAFCLKLIRSIFQKYFWFYLLFYAFLPAIIL